jgi:xanthine dehydrogenase accessory factor
MYDEFYTKAHELMQQGVPFATATVVRAEKPSSGKPGDKAIITTEGVMFGWIGGSCAQPTVIQEALRALAADESRLIRLSTSPEEQTPRDGLVDLAMTCYSGGTLEIYIEPQRPRPRLLIVGTLPVAQALAHLGKAMNYHVITVDPGGRGEGMPHADEILATLEETAGQIRPFTYVVVATHGNHDELALEKILPAQPTYVGLVASPRRAGAVRRYLAQQGISELEMLPLKAPAGLDIQARRGDEIALSIMAEIVQKRCNAELLDLALLRERTSAAREGVAQRSNASFDVAFKAPETAMDPICHMQVDIASANYVSEYDGARYYFCCAGCKGKFDANPAAYSGQSEVRAADRPLS